MSAFEKRTKAYPHRLAACWTVATFIAQSSVDRTLQSFLSSKRKLTHLFLSQKPSVPDLPTAANLGMVSTELDRGYSSLTTRTAQVQCMRAVPDWCLSPWPSRH